MRKYLLQTKDIMLDKTFRLDVRIYWEDTDAGGIVYHSNYLRYMERARTEMLRSLGFSQQQMKEAGEALIVVSKLEIAYRRPAKLDDLLTVHTRVESLKHASIVFEQTITRGDEVITQGRVRCASISSATGAPTEISPHIRQAFLDYLGKSEDSSL